MDQSLSAGYIVEVNERIDASRLLDLLGYATDKIQVVGDSIKGFCPIHRDTKFRSLVIDAPKHTFKCTIKTCPGYAGGSLVELYALTRHMEPAAAASQIVQSLSLQVDPQWLGRLLESEMEAAGEALARGDDKAAEEAALAALALQPSSVEARMFLARIYSERGESERACGEYAAAIDAQLAAGNFDEASRILDQATGVFPDSEDLFFLQVRSAELQGKTEEVVGLLQDLAAAREASGHSADNIGLFQRLIELQPDNPQHRLRLAAIHESRRDMRTAARELERAARQLISQDKGAEAIPLLEKVLKYEPQQNKLRLILADELIREGDYARAKEQIFEVANQQIENSEYWPAEQTVRRWLDIEPDSVEVYENLTRIFQEQERNAEAADALKHAAEITAKATGLEDALPYYFRIKFLQPEDLSLRHELVEKLLSLEQTQRAGFELLDLAEVYFGRGEAADGEAALQRAVSVDSSPSFRIQIAEVFLSHQLTESAEEILRQVAQAADAEGDAGAALEACERLVGLSPDDIALAQQRARLLWLNGTASAPAVTADLYAQLKSLGMDEEARALLSQAAERSENLTDSEAGEALGRLFDIAVSEEELQSLAPIFYRGLAPLTRRSAPQQLLPRSEQLAALDPQSTAALRDLAEISRALGNGSRSVEAFLALAELEEQQDQIPQALADLDEAARTAPDRPEILKRKAALVEKSAGPAAAAQAYQEYLAVVRNVAPPEEALREHEAHLQRFGDDVVSRRHYADLLGQAGRGQEARELYQALLLDAEDRDDTIEALHLRERLLALDPENPQLQAELAAALLELGDSDQAFQYLRSAARSLLGRGDAAEAVRIARQALEIESRNIEVLELLVDAAGAAEDLEAQEQALAVLAGHLRDEGHFDEAVERFAQLTELCPTNTSYREQSAEMLDLSGESQLALDEWKRLAMLLEDAKDPRAALNVYARVGDRIADAETVRRWNILANSPAGTPGDQVLATAAQATIYLEAGDVEKAQTSIDLLTTLAPQAPREAATRLLHLAEKLGDPTAAGAAYLAAANAFLAAGKSEQAADIMLIALSADPANSVAREALAQFYESMGREAEAFDHRLSLLRAALVEADREVWLQRLEEVRVRSAGDPARHLSVARILLTAPGNESRAETMRELESAVEAARAAEREEFALEICDVAPALAAISPALRNAKVDILVGQGRITDAGSWLRNCVGAALTAGASDEADQAASRWLQLSPSDPEALETAASVHERLGRTAQSVDAYLAAANVWRSVAEYANAARTLRAAVVLAPERLPLRQMLWQVLLEGRDEDGAVREMLALAMIYAGQDEPAEAIKLLERAQEHAPNSLETVEALARVTYEQEGFAAALPHFRRALLLHRREGTPEEVAAAYEAILQLEGAGVELQAEHAEYLEETGQDEQAKRQLLAVARRYRDEEKDLVQAIEYFGRATSVAPSPDDALIFEDLAALHLELKVPVFAAGAMREAARLYDSAAKPQAAIQCARQALELAEGKQRIEDMALLGTMLVRGGKTEEGAELLRDALTLAVTEREISSERRRELCSALLEADPSDFPTAELYLGLIPDRELAECAIALSRRFSQRGYAESRFRLLKLAKSMAPTSLPLRREIADSLLESGEDQEKLQRELMELCEMAAKAGDAEMAKSALESLEELPGVNQMPLLLAPLYALTGDVETAVLKYAAAAELLAAEELLEDAADALRAAMDLDASSVPAASVASVVRHSRGAATLRGFAERLLDSAIRARSRTRALVIATALLEHSSKEDGAAILKKIAAGAGAAFVVAVAGAHADWLSERDREEEAGELADFITTLVPNSPDSWWLASQLHRKAGRGQPAADAAMKAARLFNEAGAVTEEESCYREALEQFPNDVPVLETLAFFYDREKRVPDALEVMRRLAALTAQAGNHTAAANWLRKILVLAPQDDEAREHFAEALIRTKRLDEAAGQLLELGRAYAKRGNEAKAEVVYQRLLQVEPDNESAAAYLLDRATKRDDPEAVARYTIAMATAKAESGALTHACQMLRNLLVREPENLSALEKLAAFARRAQDDQTFRSATFSLGHKLIAKGDYMGAIIHYESLLEAAPGDLEVLQLLVDSCLHEGMAERGADFAQQMLEKSKEAADMRRVVAAANAILAYDPSRASVRRDLAEALLCLNRIPDAVTEWQRAAEEFVAEGDLFSAAECFRRVTQVTPDNLAAWKRLADILAFGDQPEEAREAFLHLATVYAESGDVAAAIAVLRRLADLDPQDPIPHQRCLELHLKAEREAEAIEEILWLVRFEMRRGDLPAAERLIEQGVSINPESLTLQQCRLEIIRGLGRTDELRLRMVDLADRFRSAGDLAKAAETLEQLLEHDAKQPDVRRQLGNLLLELGKSTQAYQHFSRLLEDVLQTSDPEEARDAAEAILAEHPKDPALRAQFGLVFTRFGLQEFGGRYFAICANQAAESGDSAAQISYLKLATQARPRWTEGLRQLADACAAAGDTGAAYESYQKLAGLLIEARQIPDAANAIRRQIALRPKEPQPRIQLVDLYARIGDRENRASALQDLADLYISRGQTDEAVEVYRQLIELRPDEPEVLKRFIELFAQVGNELEIVDEYLRLAEALTKKGAFVEATQTYEQILAIDRRNPVIREKFINFLQTHGQKGRALAEMRRLADTYVGRGNKASAINVLVNALAMSPRDAELCLRLAQAYEAVGNHEASMQSYARAASLLSDTAPVRAIDLYAKMLEKDPQNTELRKRLSEAYARAGDQTKAASQARRLAEVHASRGELEEAEAAYRLAASNRPETLSKLREAVQLHAHDPMLQHVDLIRYGDALMESGHTDEALDQYRKARSLNDDSPKLIQKCIDALCQIAPEREAIPDLLALAEKYLMAGEGGQARAIFDRVLRLDPKCENAKAGRDEAFKMELLSQTKGGGSASHEESDQQLLRSPRTPKKARVGMNDLLGALGDENNPSNQAAGGGGA